jgi:hypothetical protein
MASSKAQWSQFAKRAAGCRATVARLWQAAPALDDDDDDDDDDTKLVASLLVASS